MNLNDRLFGLVTIRTGDLTPADFRELREANSVACDIETSGLNFTTDSIGTVQLADDRGRTWIVQINDEIPEYLSLLMSLKSVRKVFHYAPFDLGFMREKWSVRAQNVACTKVAHRVLFPEAESHSLQFLLASLMQIEISKESSIRVSDWLVDNLSEQQVEYAVRDVAYLIPLLHLLMEMAAKKGLSRVLDNSFAYLPTRIETERLNAGDVFAY